MKTLVLASVLSLGMIGCAQNEEPAATEVALNQQKRVTQETFKKYIADHSDAQIIDIRTPGEFAEGNIAGAVNINYNSGDFTESMNKLDKTKPILIYCHSGGRSGKALKSLQTMDFGTILELEGGFSNWTK
ncbi:MAG: rhodanese-related sulfurtransferase [Flavobacteriales bacterium]|jgi:rhodanese-related sulfurtransferase